MSARPAPRPSHRSVGAHRLPVALPPSALPPSTRRGLVGGMLLAPLMGALPAAAQPAPPRPGTDYRILPSPQPAPADRVQVLEFFFYGCPFCAQLEPLLVAWLRRQPPDLQFDRVPVVARDSWVPFAKLYYTLADLGVLERVHPTVYRAIHDEGLQLGQFEVARDWAGRSGLDRDRFSAAWRSAKVESLVDRARQLTDDYDIQSTPSMVVDGRLLTSSGLTAGVPALLPMVDRLVGMVRAGRAAPRP